MQHRPGAAAEGAAGRQPADHRTAAESSYRTGHRHRAGATAVRLRPGLQPDGDLTDRGGRLPIAPGTGTRRRSGAIRRGRTNWGFATGFFWGTAWGISAQPLGLVRIRTGRGNNININVNNNNVWVNRPQYRTATRTTATGITTSSIAAVSPIATAAANNRYRPTNSASVQTRENYRGRDNVRSAPRHRQSTLARAGAGHDWTGPARARQTT